VTPRPSSADTRQPAPDTRSVAVADLDPRDAYRLLISVVVPRPIGWISSISAAGEANLAPFSFFNAVAGPPPTVMVSVSQRGGTVAKDTVRNAEETREFVAHIVERRLAEQMNTTSGEWPHGVDEFERAGLARVASTDVRPYRLADAAVALECRLTQVVPVEGTRYTMLLGQVARFHLREGLLRANGLADPRQLDPIARLGGDEYTSLGDVFEMIRPRVEGP
jgi:flavin reductase (DIM6/NTAB) family NADH-FMN oxidoreductase RutF